MGRGALAGDAATSIIGGNSTIPCTRRLTVGFTACRIAHFPLSRLREGPGARATRAVDGC
jgi:hypothetical protein